VHASEEFACAARDKWLGLFGHDRHADFWLDGSNAAGDRETHLLNQPFYCRRNDSEHEPVALAARNAS
jgi:hypothetical protein